MHLLEVGPALFISLLIITLFIPIFTLVQEGRRRLAAGVHETYAMAGAALLAIVVIPI